jgi:hypothetical protein
MVTKNNQRNVLEKDIPQGWKVLICGIIGSFLGILPAAIFIPGVYPVLPGMLALPWLWTVLVPICWACFVGWPITYFWSKWLHERVDECLRHHLFSAGELTPEEQVQYPRRIRWLPAWLGIFERAFYCLLIGLHIEGGAVFIAGWVALKMAGGWQLWSRGTTYGRAIFFSGLLGNTMSVLFGVVSGLVIRFYSNFY